MKQININNRKLYFLKLEEIIKCNYFNAEFTLLIYADSLIDIKELKLYLKPVINSNCSEIYCVGKKAEELHDLIDEVIEDQGMTEILTTWASNEMDEEICSYFINLAGMKPPQLFVVSQNNQLVEKILENYVLKHFSKSID